MADVFYRLHNIDPPEDHEPLLGYLFRISADYGYGSLRHLFQAGGYDWVHLRFYKQLVNPIAFMIGKLPEKTLLMNYNAPNGELCKEATWFRGERLQPWQINQCRPKLCLSCMREKLLIKDLWDLTLVVACPKHQELLTRFCPDCGRGLTWRRPEILKCHCGHNFANDEQKIADEGILNITQLILTSLGAADSQNHREYPQNISKIPAVALMQFVGLIGMTATGRQGINLKKIRALNFLEKIEVIKRADDVLSHWPQNFQSFLEQIMGMEKVSKPGSFREEMFGSFYTRLAYARGRHFDFVMKEMAAFENKRLARQDQIVPPETVKVTELSFARKQLKSSPEAVLKSAQGGGLVLVRERRYRVPSRIVIEHESLKRFKKRAANRISYSGARKLLALDQKPMDSLLHSGALTKDGRTILDGRADYSLIKTDCLKILKTINLRAKPLSKLPTGAKTVDFTRLLATYTSRDLPIKIFLDLVLDGEIQIYCDKTIGNFKDFRFLTSDIREFVTGYLRGEEDLMTYEEIQNEFQLGESVVRQLLTEGKVEDRKIALGGRVFQFVPRESLEKWLSEYVSLKGIFIPGLGRVRNPTLKRLGVLPVLRPNQHGGAYWYRRQEVEKGSDLLCHDP